MPIIHTVRHQTEDFLARRDMGSGKRAARRVGSAVQHVTTDKAPSGFMVWRALSPRRLTGSWAGAETALVTYVLKATLALRMLCREL